MKTTSLILGRIISLVIGSIIVVMVADSSGASRQLPVPERGFISSESAETWE